ncbi:MAG: putative cysteine desulfurase [candidate division WS2 bacterium]|nr:putative cysteine desulfurase [Candidatus Lithacetigena glycinireducens]MBT9175159.1 putative cysteine desulfurase [Candidatus Lithacetigena glycinireducens]
MPGGIKIYHLKEIYKNMLNVKNQFPFFTNNPGITYMDSAATTQKPRIVLDKLVDFYTTHNANAGRSSYPIANQLTNEVEEVREKVGKFINASKKEEIIFTSGATDGFNKIAYTLGIHYLKDGDEVLYCPQDHKSFVLPWFKVQRLVENMGVAIRLVPFRVNKMGSIDRDDLFSKVTDKTKIINATHIHNIYGADSDINKIRDWLGDKDVIINVDAAQSVGHRLVDVQQLGADILSFSGHKMFAIQGVGATFITKKLHQFMEPIFVGGSNGVKLHDSEVEVTNFSQAYESGTQNYAGILTLGKAIEFIEQLGIENIYIHLSELTQYLLQKLRQLPKIEFVYGPNFWSCADGAGILSFKVGGLSASEAGFMLAENGILVRTGDHCISSRDEFTNTIRISMHVYNTTDDIDFLIKILKTICK